jgi:hypothetical protein
MTHQTLHRQVARVATILAIATAALLPAYSQTPKNPAEKFVLDQLKLTGAADLSGQPEKNLHHEFVEALIANAHSGISITGATIDGTLSINNTTLAFPLTFQTCKMPDGFDLESNAFARDFTLSDCEIGSEENDSKAQALFISSTFAGAVILDGSKFHNGVDFTDTQIGGQLYSSCVHFTSPTDQADFDSTRIQGQALFQKSHFHSTLNFKNAQLFYLDIESAPDDDPCPNKSVENGVDLDLNQAHIEHGLTLKGLHLSLTGGLLDVEGKAKIRQITPRNPDKYSLDLSHSHFQSLCIESPESMTNRDLAIGVLLYGISFDWIAVLSKDDPNIDGFSCDDDNLPPLNIHTPSGRRLLDLFKNSQSAGPTPYLQLEAFLQRVGNDEDADETYFQMRREQRRSFSWYRQAIDWILDVSVRYGRRPMRASFPWIVLFGIGVYLFWSKDKMEKENGSTDDWYCPIWYSLDLISPVDLGIATKWRPGPAHPNLRAYAQIHRIAGWILIPLIAAAATGFIK